MTRIRIEDKEDNVIQLSSHPQWKRVYPCEQYTLTEAREFLGRNYFNKALCVWSLEELQRTINHPQCGFTDAFDAYSAIQRFRLNRAATTTAQVIPIREAA
jgi:hypothetical protein